MNSIYTKLSIILLALFLYGCASTGSNTNKSNIATMRTHKEKKVLSDTDAQKIALLAVPFARFATHVYCNYDFSSQFISEEKFACDKMPDISNTGWKKLFDWKEILTAEEMESGLQFMAFARMNADNETEIIIGFRGTDFISLSDWRSNLRWFTQFLPIPGSDQYQIVHLHSKRMINLARERATEKFPMAKGFKIYTTGHSLGGGLAQLLAFSDEEFEGSVVFDPSPVTGYYNLVTDEEVNCKVNIMRVYERREVLHYIRSGLRTFYNLSDNIQEVSFDTIHSHGNPVLNHSMSKLKIGLEKIANISADARQTIDKLPGSKDMKCYEKRKLKL